MCYMAFVYIISVTRYAYLKVTKTKQKIIKFILFSSSSLLVYFTKSLLISGPSSVSYQTNLVRSDQNF